MRGRILTILSILSLLLCLATIALWVRGYVLQDLVHTHRRHQTHRYAYDTDQWFYSVRGQLLWRIDILTEPVRADEGDAQTLMTPAPPSFYHETDPTDAARFHVAESADPWWERCGFRYEHDVLPAAVTVSVYELGLPHWFVALCFALLPARWVVLWRRRRKLPPNVCPTCGYDLRATPQGGRCPECGKEVAAAPSPGA